MGFNPGLSNVNSEGHLIRQFRKVSHTLFRKAHTKNNPDLFENKTRLKTVSDLSLWDMAFYIIRSRNWSPLGCGETLLGW